MAQRGGSVDTVVRFGEVVHSPVVDPGRCRPPDRIRAHRGRAHAAYLRPGGRLVVNQRAGCAATGAHRRSARSRGPRARARCRRRDLPRRRGACVRGGQSAVGEHRAARCRRPTGCRSPRRRGGAIIEAESRPRPSRPTCVRSSLGGRVCGRGVRAMSEHVVQTAVGLHRERGGAGE